ncbi:hypothetical protein ABID59_004280 [Bradyrhizobium sp. S3.3.6]
MLVLIGATPEGRKELVGFTDGARESAHDWRDLLLDLKRHGLNVAPQLVIADGTLGFWKAAGEVWPKRASSAAGCTRPPDRGHHQVDRPPAHNRRRLTGLGRDQNLAIASATAI